MTRSACLIFNPVAGQGDPDQDLALIQRLLTPQIELEVKLTTADSDPSQLAEAAIIAGVDIIIASGGDGTVSAVAQTVMSTGIAFGVIPRGTANAFAVAMGIPTNINGACEVILADKTRAVDSAICNGNPLILLAGIGFEAETIERADRETKDRLGVLAYILAGIQQLHEQQLFDVAIEIQGIVSHFRAGAVTIANAAPPTSVLAQGLGEVIPNDGLLDITIATSENTLQTFSAIADLLGAALIRNATNREDIICFRTRHIKVMTDPPQKVVVDGEIIGTTPIEVTCVPQCLLILAPPSVTGNERTAGWQSYLLQTETQLSEWNTKIEDLQAKVEDASPELKAEILAQVAALQSKWEVLSVKLAALEAAFTESEDAYSDLYSAMEGVNLSLR